MRIVKPGVGENKDAYWNGENTMEQCKVHLASTFDKYKHDIIDIADVYDNSSNHGCLPKDALVVNGKINKYCGYCRKDPLLIREGWYNVAKTTTSTAATANANDDHDNDGADEEEIMTVKQFLTFKVEDTVLEPIKAGHKLKIGGVVAPVS